jgi:hypothetical protein
LYWPAAQAELGALVRFFDLQALLGPRFAFWDVEWAFLTEARQRTTRVPGVSSSPYGLCTA